MTILIIVLAAGLLVSLSLNLLLVRMLRRIFDGIHKLIRQKMELIDKLLAQEADQP